jgi:hypothetical protein
MWNFGTAPLSLNWGKEELPVARKTSHRLGAGAKSKLPPVIYRMGVHLNWLAVLGGAVESLRQGPMSGGVRMVSASN